MTHHPTTLEILELFAARGNSQYGGEAVSQIEHGLQAAFFAEQASAPASLIAAALLHDVGHLLHRLPDGAPESGIDDHHEVLAARWLEKLFPAEVVDPVHLHVAAKRYLCATDETYLSQLSPPSILSLELQGGPMTAAEVRDFQQRSCFESAIALRRWDEAAKVPALLTPPLEHFAQYVDLVAQTPQSGSPTCHSM